MKILITGCSLSQLPKYAERNLWFSSLLTGGLAADNEITWQQPTVDMSDEWLSQFDRVLVGVTPPLAQTSRFLYGTLSVIERLWGDPRLRFMVDARQPELITRGFNSLLRNKDSITKPFFSDFPDYGRVVDDARLRARLLMTVIRLTSSPWPPTISPRLPWMSADADELKVKLPAKAVTDGNIQAIIPDSGVFSRIAAAYEQPETLPYVAATHPWSWSYETATDYSWVEGRNVLGAKTAITSDYRVAGFDRTLSELSHSRAFLTGPARARKKTPGPLYWTPTVALALGHRLASDPATAAPLPVFTDWQISGQFHSSFSALASTFSGYESSMRSLGLEQATAYRRGIPGRHTFSRQANDFIGKGNWSA